MDAHNVFQMIFGVIASIFILMFLLQYTGVYSGMQEQSQSVIILKNFNKLAGDVYLTGNPIDYHDFSNFGLDKCFAFFNEPDSPVIKCDNLEYPTFVPMIFHSGDDVLIDAGYSEEGWWTTNFVLVYPELKIIFNPLKNDAKVTGMMRNITSIFNCELGVEGFACNDVNRGNPFPTSLQLEPRVKFGFCDGATLSYENLCGSESCERYDFLNMLYGLPGRYSACTAQMPSDNFKVVMITDSCPTPEMGVCIETSDGVGRMKIAGSGKTYVYKDILDIMAVIIGGDEKSRIGSILGETNYIFKNEISLKRLYLGSKIIAKKAEMLSNEADEKCCSRTDQAAGRCSPMDELSCECAPLFDSLRLALCSGSSSVCELTKQDYMNQARMKDLKEKTDAAAALSGELESLGCSNV